MELTHPASWLVTAACLLLELSPSPSLPLSLLPANLINHSGDTARTASHSATRTQSRVTVERDFQPLSQEIHMRVWRQRCQISSFLLSLLPPLPPCLSSYIPLSSFFFLQPPLRRSYCVAIALAFSERCMAFSV